MWCKVEIVHGYDFSEHDVIFGINISVYQFLERDVRN